MLSLNAVSALTRSSLYGEKLQSDEITAANSGQETKITSSVVQPLNHHTQDLLPLDYERKLEILRTKIEEKKCQFRELALGQRGLPEERLDLERALKRMDKLLELPSSTLMEKVHEGDKKTFDIYLEDVNRLLEFNSRELNYVLASTPIPTEEDVLIEICNHQAELKEMKESQLQNWFLSVLPRWNVETNNFQATQDEYFYLPVLPIVIKKSNFPETLKRHFPRYEGKTLSTSDIEKLNAAAALIVRSNWKEAMNTSLQLTESVHIVTGMYSAGKAGRPGHTLLSIENNDDEYDLAKTIIHEDDHHALRNNKKFKSVLYHEIDEKTPPVNHIWVQGGSRAILIEELFTHQAGVLFYHHLLSNGLVPKPKVRKVAGSILHNLKRAKQAIELLEKEPQYLNEDGVHLLNDAKEFWYGFEKDFIREPNN